MAQQVKLGDFIGTELEEDFLQFDLTEIEEVLVSLRDIEPLDIAHSELLQQMALRGADILGGYLGKIVKTVGYLEGRVNSIKNKVALDYKAPDGSRTTTDMKIWASQSSPEVEAIQIKLSQAKACKMVIEKKYDIIIKSHHHKDIAQGLRRTVLGYHATSSNENIPKGYE